MKMPKLSPAAYGVFLIGIAGFGGLLYGVDLGVIAAALLYLSKTTNLTLDADLGDRRRGAGRQHGVLSHRRAVGGLAWAQAHHDHERRDVSGQRRY